MNSPLSIKRVANRAIFAHSSETDTNPFTGALAFLKFSKNENNILRLEISSVGPALITTIIHLHGVGFGIMQPDIKRR